MSERMDYPGVPASELRGHPNAEAVNVKAEWRQPLEGVSVEQAAQLEAQLIQSKADLGELVTIVEGPGA